MPMFGVIINLTDLLTRLKSGFVHLVHFQTFTPRFLSFIQINWILMHQLDFNASVPVLINAISNTNTEMQSQKKYRNAIQGNQLE